MATLRLLFLAAVLVAVAVSSCMPHRPCTEICFGIVLPLTSDRHISRCASWTLAMAADDINADPIT